ncbi:hypothetical protein Thermo_00940 [Thermoplasmatales archaeon]|nr:hypothetical protein Thermo_00940 [Thermoplasmatales archaeon]
MDKTKSPDFKIPELSTSRNENNTTRERIISTDSEERKSLGINKSTLWYQQKRLKKGKLVKLYKKTRSRIE